MYLAIDLKKEAITHLCFMYLNNVMFLTNYIVCHKNIDEYVFNF